MSNELFNDDEQIHEPEEEQASFEIFKSNRGGSKLFMNGFSFERYGIKQHNGTSTEYWRCEKFRKHNNCCPARLNTVINLDGSRVISKDPGEHNHEGRAERAKVAEKVSLLKTVAIENTGKFFFFNILLKKLQKKHF